MRAILNYHTGNELRVIEGAIQTPSGGPATVRVVRYDAGTGSCKVSIFVSEAENWEETWDLTKRHSPERATFMRSSEGDFSQVVVTLKKA